MRGKGLRNRAASSSEEQLTFLDSWLKEMTVEREGWTIDRIALRELYWAACDEAGYPTPSDKAFSAQLQRLRPQVDEITRVYPDGERVRLFGGLSFT
jgi:hypothetical protein